MGRLGVSRVVRLGSERGNAKKLRSRKYFRGVAVLLFFWKKYKYGGGLRRGVCVVRSLVWVA